MAEDKTNKGQELFPDINKDRLRLSSKMSSALKSNGLDPVNIQNNINSLYDAGGEKRLEAIRYASNVFSQVGGDNTLANMLTSQSKPLSQAEVQAQTGQVSGKQLVLGNIYNAAIPATIEGVGQLANSVFVAPVEKLLTGETKMAEANQKVLEKSFESKKVYIDEASKIAPVSVGADGKIDWSNIANTRAWAGLLSQGVGSMLPSLIPGAGAIAAVKAGANAAKTINIAKTTGLLLSTAQMYPELQREGLKNNLTFGESSAVAGVLSLGMGAVEMLSFNSMLKGFGLTAKEAPTVIKEMTKSALQEEIKELGAKGFTSATFNEAIARVSKKVAKDVSDPKKVGVFASVAKATRGTGSRIGRGFMEGGLVEGSEEFIQGMMEYMGKEAYNNWLSSEGTKEGQGQYTVDFKESFVNSMLGATVGGILGTGIGSLYKQNGGTKVLDQTLYGLVKADINTQILDGQTDFNKILENNAFKGIVETAREEGQFNNEDGSFNESNYNDALRRGNLMYQTAFEFKDAAGFDDRSIMSMYKMANQRDELAIDSDRLDASIKEMFNVDIEIEIAKSERRFVDLVKLNTQKSSLEKQLGEINTETGKYILQEEMVLRNERTEELFKESLTPILDMDTSTRDIGHMMLNSGLSALSNEDFDINLEIPIPGDRIAIRGRTNTDGVHLRELLVEDALGTAETDVPIENQLESGVYTPLTRYKYTMLPITKYSDFSGSLTAIDLGHGRKNVRDISSPYDYDADARSIIETIKDRLAIEASKDIKVDGAIDGIIDKGYNLINQLLKKSKAGGLMSREDFESFLEFDKETGKSTVLTQEDKDRMWANAVKSVADEDAKAKARAEEAREYLRNRDSKPAVNADEPKSTNSKKEEAKSIQPAIRKNDEPKNKPNISPKPPIEEGTAVKYKGHKGKLRKEGIRPIIEKDNGDIVEIADWEEGANLRDLGVLPDEKLNAPKNKTYEIGDISNDDITINGTKYTYELDTNGNIIGLIPENNPDQVIRNEGMLIAAEIERNKLEYKSLDGDIDSIESLPREHKDAADYLLSAPFFGSASDEVLKGIDDILGNNDLFQTRKDAVIQWIDNVIANELPNIESVNYRNSLLSVLQSIKSDAINRRASRYSPEAESLGRNEISISGVKYRMILGENGNVVALQDSNFNVITSKRLLDVANKERNLLINKETSDLYQAETGESFDEAVSTLPQEHIEDIENSLFDVVLNSAPRDVQDTIDQLVSPYDWMLTTEYLDSAKGWIENTALDRMSRLIEQNPSSQYYASLNDVFNNILTDINNRINELNREIADSSFEEISQEANKANREQAIKEIENQKVRKVENLSSKEVYRRVDDIHPTNEYDLVLKYFALGGKVHPDVVKDIVGKSRDENIARKSITDENSRLVSWDMVGEHIFENIDLYTNSFNTEPNFDAQSVANAVDVAILRNTGKRKMANSLILANDMYYEFTPLPIGSMVGYDINEEIDGETTNTETGGQPTSESPTVESSILAEQELEQSLGYLQTQEAELSRQLESANAIADQEQESEITDEYISGLTEQLESTNRQLESEYGQAEVAVGQDIGETIEESSDSDTSQEGDGDTQQEISGDLSSLSRDDFMDKVSVDNIDMSRGGLLEYNIRTRAANEAKDVLSKSITKELNEQTRKLEQVADGDLSNEEVSQLADLSIYTKITASNSSRIPAGYRKVGYFREYIEGGINRMEIVSSQDAAIHYLVSKTNELRERNVFEARNNELYDFRSDTDKYNSIDDIVYLLESNGVDSYPILRDSLVSSSEVIYDDDGSVLPFQFDSKETSVSTPLGQDILARLQGSFPNINLSIPSSVDSYLQVLNSIPSAKQIFTPDNKPYGFVNPIDGSIYLDPSRLNPNTAIHEYGHVWVMSQRGTDVYNRGVGLVANTAYATSVKNDPRYANLTQDQILEEALAQAIGDKGARFVLTSKKNSLLDFIGELFNKIKEFFGLKSNNVADMTFDDFIQESVESILSGNEVSGISSEDLASLMSVPVPKTTVGANQYGNDSIPTVYGEGITAEEKHNNMQSTGEVLFSYKAPPTKDFATNDDTGELTGTWDDFISKAKEMLVQYNLLGKNAADFTAADKVALTHIQKRTGFVYKGRNGSVEGQQAPKGVWSDKYDLFEHDLKNANETFYMADGRLTTQPVKGMAGTERGSLVSAIQKGLSFYQDLDPNTSYGRFMKGALDSVLAPGGLANNETLFTFLDGGEGVIISLLKDVKRLGEKNQAYLLSHIAPKLERTKELMREYSTFGNQSNVDAVKKMDLEVYEWNPVTRKGEKRTIVVPIGTAMHILSDIESQEATGQQYLTGKGKNGDVFHETAVLPSDLFRGDEIDESNVEEFFFGKTFSASSGGEVQSIRKGVHVRADLLRMRDEKGNLVRLTDINGGNVAEYPVLISPSTKTRLQNRFNKAIGAENDNEVEAYKAARELLNDPLLTKMLEEENKMLNPLDTFKKIEKEVDGVKVGMYSPIRPVKSVADNGRDVAYSPRIEEARILNERTHRPDAIYASDLLASIDSYIDTSSNVVGNGRLVHNMESLKNAIDKEYDGVARDKISKVLGTNIEQLSNYKQYLSKQLDDSTYASFLNTLIKKYTKWIFAGNIGIAAKQIGTILSAFGQGYIDDGYLLSVAVPQSLKLLGGGIYDTFRGAGSTIVEGTDKGQRTFTGAMTVEKEQLDWLLGNHLTDPVQREAHRQRWAVVINRTLTGQNQYLAKFEMSDITATPEGAGKLRSGWDKVGNFLEEHGMAPMKRADRAAILAFVEAAKAQVNNEVKNGITAQEDADDRIATITTNLVYDTNQMNSVADFTGAQRSASLGTKIITLYSGQTQKLFNQILQRGAEYHQIINDPNASEEDKSLARRRLAGSLVSNLVSNPAYMAITTMGWAYMRAIMNGDEPPEEDESKIASEFWWNYARYAGGVIPGMTEQFMTLTISRLDDQPWSEGLLEVPGVAALESSIDIVKNLYSAISEDDIEKQKKYTEGLWYHGSQIIGVATGLPKPLTDLVREHMTIDRDDRLRGEE